MWILFWRRKWGSKNTGSVVTGVLIGLFISFVLRRISFTPACTGWIPHFGHQTQKLVVVASSEGTRASTSTNEYQNVPVHANERTDRKALILVGVMTAHKYLKTRARSTFKTWGQDVPGKIIYFTGSNSSQSWVKAGDIPVQVPIVMLPGVDDSYPPRKKSFMMLKYMYEHYGDKFEWFMRADDDVYIRMDLLANLLRSIDSSKMHFIGQAGLGSDFERGMLHLGPHENFCMGGPGIIFSRSTLEKLIPNIDSCLDNVRSNHEDVELGRCVNRAAGLACTWSYEMRNLFHHSTTGTWQAFKNHKYHNAITMHPLKNHATFYQIHSHFLGLKVQKLMYESVKIDRDLYQIGSYSESVNRTGLSPSMTKYCPTNRTNILTWDFLSDIKTTFTHRSENPKYIMAAASRESLRNAAQDLMDIVNKVSKVRGRAAEMKNLIYGYHRVNPLYGEDYVLDLLMMYRNYDTGMKSQMVQPVRRHAYIQKPFGPLQLRIDKSTPVLKLRSQQLATANSVPTDVVMVLPLTGRLPTLDRFLKHFHKTHANLGGRIQLKLVIVHFRQSEADVMSLQNLIDSNTNSMHASNVQVISMEEEFSRGLALDRGISECLDNDLVFVIDVDFVFSSQVIHRIVMNTAKSEKVYFPIISSLYDPRFRSVEEPDSISNRNGYWRENGYGIAAFYKSDYTLIGGYDLSIKGWGKEDVLLFEKFVASNLTVFRAPDPELIHIYHGISCDKKLSRVQYNMCLGSQATTFGDTESLMQYVFSNRKKSKILGAATATVLNNSSTSVSL